MRLRQFEVKNFKGLGSVTLLWDDILVLIGQNNTGKSTVLQSLEVFLSGSTVKDPVLFRHGETDEDHAIEVIGYFDGLSDAERAASAVRGRMSDDDWILKKRFWHTIADDKWHEQYYSFSSSEVFDGWPDPDTTWDSFPTAWTTHVDQVRTQSARPNSETREILKDLLRSEMPEVVSSTAPEWIPNPGGGGNWKSNANSILPRLIAVRAVHDAGSETNAKETATYGRILSLVLERQLARRDEVRQLQEHLKLVLELICPPDGAEPAEEIRDLLLRLNEKLNTMIPGRVSLRTDEPNLKPIVMPSTRLVVNDAFGSSETPVEHQGHGMQRALIMSLVQLLAELESEPSPREEGEELEVSVSDDVRPVILAIEEAELYMHPHMARSVRDALYSLASNPNYQVICTTHSPIFLDLGAHHSSVARFSRDARGDVSCLQVVDDLYGDDDETRQRLRMMASFDASTNEVFFATRVVLLEEQSAVVAFRTGAEASGVFRRHPRVEHDVTIIDCAGKGSIPLFQEVLNHFQIPYLVVHDYDRASCRDNERIAAACAASNGLGRSHALMPVDLESTLGYSVNKDKPYRAYARVSALAAADALPPAFVKAMNLIYFGSEDEPTAASSVVTAQGVGGLSSSPELS